MDKIRLTATGRRTAEQVIELDRRMLKKMKPHVPGPATTVIGLSDAEVNLFMRLTDAIRFCAKSGDLGGVLIPETVITESALGAMRPVVEYRRRVKREMPCLSCLPAGKAAGRGGEQ